MVDKSIVSQVLSVTKSDAEIRKTILTNILRMLVYRRWLDSEKWTNETIMSRIETLKNNTDDEILIATMNNTKIYVKMLPVVIMGLNKVPSLGEFIDKYKNEYKIVIVKEISDKAKNTLLDLHDNIEIFREKTMLFDLVSHHLSPQYVVLTNEQVNELLLTYNCTLAQLAKISKNDPIASYLKLKKNQVVRIIRNSEVTGQVPFYRVMT